MTTVVLLGGNGYIGRAVTKLWLAKDRQVEFVVVSRSGNNKLKDSRIRNVTADVTNYDSVVAVMPEKFDYIVDLVGRPEKDTAALEKVNRLPANIMKRIAEEKQVRAMGFIGGVLGPKSFTLIKSDIIKQLKNSRIRLEVVEPTLVYGEDRNDGLSKLVPIFKFLGTFSKGLKPVLVTRVAEELVEKLVR
ncbi:NAD-dependent epimerase/dehydratase family protein [Paenibacillus glycanilyticus]|uniref:UDP-glucose 4-epimerase n=1 Tax=Paenibacillus glycanilyticus TaxID=126569 RepID=A0ABQ6GL14_9BACL|nr:NAD-dependent epimerase/dehydratase family protein [Paenibacillus glycanilyticus]GLX69727.1 UDP-glucose 4-epimerase [Paenibacillus glycanilyticus]